jgi:polysaccharide biosynthesis/export protein
MFKTPENHLNQQVAQAESNYIIQKNDALSLEVYTNQGEKIIDPNRQSFDQTTGGSQPADAKTYLVEHDGLVRLPLINTIKLEGLTIRQAEAILEKEFAKYYLDPFVSLKFMNKRVVVLGAPGGQVIPLTHENMRLTEILALAKEINNDAKVHNIRVLRGEQAFIADLSTIDGYRKDNMVMMPGDIVYVEPVRRPFSEGLRDYGAVVSLFTSLTTLIIVILR